MSFSNYSNQLYMKVIETSETVCCGGVTAGQNMQLRHVVLTLYKQGTHAATEKLRVKLYHDVAMTKVYATSDWSFIADIDSVPTNWLGRLRFDFPEASMPWIGPNQTYYFAVETANYTRNGETHYLALSLDWPFTINSNADAIQMAIYGYRNVQK